MIGRVAIVALAVGLAGCAGLEPAGRNARSSGPVATAPAPQRSAPQQTAALPPPQQAPAPQPQVSQTPQPAPQLTVPPAAQRQQPAPAVAAPPPQRTQPSAPPAAAPNVSVAPSAPAQETTQARARSSDDDIVVQGQVQNQVRPPVGDPRTNEERRADIRSWDQCITQVQSAFDSDPMSPQLTTPEEYCSSSLGMADRTSVPTARQGRRR